MKSKFLLSLAFLSLCLISGSAAAAGQRLYPVKGPLSAQAPAPVYTAKLTGTTSGKISVVLSNGETFNGTWTAAYAPFIAAETPGSAAGNPPQTNPAAAWDAVYGRGYYVASILGVSIGQAVALGDKGSVLQLEFVNGKFGVAADNKGNIYKMIW